MTQRDMQLNDLYKRKFILKEILTYACWCEDCRKSVTLMLQRIEAQIEILQGEENGVRCDN